MATDVVASSSTVIAAGALVDGWRLHEQLHVGGMAQLWSVTREPGMPAPATLAEGDVPALIMKIPRIKGGEDPASIVGFEVERMILPTLRGRHVPRYIARGDFTQQPYLVMERIDGASLEPRLLASPLAIHEVAELGARVATALHDVHRQGLVHLDLKPANVMLRSDGSAVLIDFGLSHHQRLPDLLEEEFSFAVGTGPYMSPEQLQHQRHDPRSDLFALGVMLYHFTTGARPFGAPDSVRGLRRRLYVDPIPPRVLRADCPPWLQELILTCLEVKPARRWQSAAQLVLALQDPSQITLTSRALRLRRNGAFSRLTRWLKAIGGQAPDDKPVETTAHLAHNPILLAAVDVAHDSADFNDALRETVRRVLRTMPHARLACVSVMKTARIAMDVLVDEQGQSHHVKQLIALKHWARPISKSLKPGDGRLTFHVLEAHDVASAIVEFAQRSHVDHIVMGAHGHSALRRYLGSVSTQVVAQAACSVTVARR